MENDYQLAIQGIGDRAYRELLNIYEAEFARLRPENALTTDSRQQGEWSDLVFIVTS